MRPLALALVAVALAGCHTVTAGTVTGLWLQPAHDVEREKCTLWIKVCYRHEYWTEHVPDTCYVDLTDEQGTTRYEVGCERLAEAYPMGSRVVVK